MKKAIKKKAQMSARKLCRKIIPQEGVNLKTGQLKKGFRWKKGGGVIRTKK